MSAGDFDSNHHSRLLGSVLSVRSGGRIVYKPVLDVLAYKETSETVRKEHFNSHTKNILFG